MKALEAFKNSNMWDKRYDLPLSPQNNNPWFYLACSVKIIKDYDNNDLMEDMSDVIHDPAPFYDKVNKHLISCEKEPGLFNRWPDGSGGVTSHDELMGISYLNRDAANRILDYLAKHDGNYINTSDVPKIPEEWNLYKFYWFIQFVKACAGMQISYISQFQWCIYIIWDMFTTKANTDDAGGRLRAWIMLDKMDKFPLCSVFVKMWKNRMNKLGITPKAMLTIEPKENPVMGEYGKTNF